MGTGSTDLLGGRYELGDLLGSGGTGSVWRARDAVLGREVAVKKLRPGQDRVTRERLRTEARLAGSLHHPGIAQVYDFGEEPSATPGEEAAPYLVMQFVEGTSLAALLRERGTLPPGQVMGIVAQVAAGLQVAHDRGIVHRDIKPGNVIITPAGRAVLVDFGIARTLETEPLTSTGTIVGTVDYISPEQSRGYGATPRSDLYSLGLVAYEALTARKPFRRETQVATALAHLNDDVPALGEEVPSGVRDLIAGLTRKDPDDRPQTAAVVAARATELSADLPLTAALLGTPGPPTDAAPGPGPAVPARPPEDRRRPVPLPTWLRPAQALGVVGVALVLVAGLSVWAASREGGTVVPDVEGMPLAQASAALLEAGLVVEERLVDDPDAEGGTVLRQDPAAGASAEDDATVRLRVASGEVRLRAGDVLGRSYQRAARVLARLGLVPDREEVVRAAGLGRVVEVGPVGRLPLGSTVTLVVAVPGSDADVAGGTDSTTSGGASSGDSTDDSTTSTAGGTASDSGGGGSGGSGGDDPGSGHAPAHAGDHGPPRHAGGPGGPP